MYPGVPRTAPAWVRRSVSEVDEDGPVIEDAPSRSSAAIEVASDGDRATASTDASAHPRLRCLLRRMSLVRRHIRPRLRKSNPEVADEDAAVLAHENIVRLEIAMHEPRLVRCCEPASGRFQHSQERRATGEALYSKR